MSAVLFHSISIMFQTVTMMTTMAAAVGILNLKGRALVFLTNQTLNSNSLRKVQSNLVLRMRNLVHLS